MKNQKKIAASVLGISPKRVKLDVSKLDEIKEAITKDDIRYLIKNKVIQGKPEKGISKGRTRLSKLQKKKGRGVSQGSRKGTFKARNPKKEVWMNKIRLQRSILKNMKEKGHITPKIFQEIYRKAKGGYFRSKRHLKLYLQEKELLK